MKKLVKKPLLLLAIGFIIGYITSVIADTINSNEVLYDNSIVNSNVDNVQDALNDMYRIYNRSGLGFSLLTHNPVGLSNELIGGLYRYQGATADNYICFGTLNKDTCTGDTDKYMYRIIGINTSGQMKLIKKEALNTTYYWNSSGSVAWPYSELFIGLNGSYFLDNSTYIPDESWKNRIATFIWKYGNTNNKGLSAAEMYNVEMGFNDTVSAKIGLMYLHDYDYAMVGGKNCASVADRDACKLSWIFLDKNDATHPGSNETVMTNGTNSYYKWYILSNGMLDLQYHDSAVRPVFYLNSNQSIASGSGTLSDPYILN